MFRKNLHNILFAIALLIILYGAYRALFGTVEGLGKKQLGKLCIKNKTEISKCGTRGLDLTNKSVFKDFKKAIRAQKKICKADCKSDYDKLGYRSKRKCKQKLCRTKTVANGLLTQVVAAAANGLLTAAAPAANGLLTAAAPAPLVPPPLVPPPLVPPPLVPPPLVPPPPLGNGKNDFDENCNEYVDGYIKYIRMLAHDESTTGEETGDILLELVPAHILEEQIQVAHSSLGMKGAMAMWRWIGGDPSESDCEFFYYSNPWVDDVNDPINHYFQFTGKDGKMSTGSVGTNLPVNKLLEMIVPHSRTDNTVPVLTVESVSFNLNNGTLYTPPFNLTFSVDPNDCDD